MIHLAGGLCSLHHVALFVVAGVGRRLLRRSGKVRLRLGRQRHAIAELRFIALLGSLRRPCDARTPPGHFRFTLHLLVVGRLARRLIGGPGFLALWRPRRIETGGLRVGTHHAVDGHIALELFLEHLHDDGIIGGRIDALGQRAGGMSQRQGAIAEAKHAGFGQHDFGHLIPLADAPPQRHPFLPHGLREVAVRFGCRLRLRGRLRCGLRRGFRRCFLRAGRHGFLQWLAMLLLSWR